MPTGYTANIKDGISFETFILQCARAFGALILMRDEPSDAPIPDEFKPSDHYTKRIEEAKARLSMLRGLTDEQKKDECEVYNKANMTDWARREHEKSSLKDKYEAMLKNVSEWEPPTKDHEGLKDFMLRQITDSIEFDCKPYEQPKIEEYPQWHKDEIDIAIRSLTFYTEENEKEVTRTNERTEWVRRLRESLDKTKACTV